MQKNCQQKQKKERKKMMETIDLRNTKDGVWYYGSGNDHGWLKVKMPVTAWKPLENIPYSKVPETALEEIKEYSRLEDIDEP